MKNSEGELTLAVDPVRRLVRVTTAEGTQLYGDTVEIATARLDRISKSQPPVSSKSEPPGLSRRFDGGDEPRRLPSIREPRRLPGDGGDETRRSLGGVTHEHFHVVDAGKHSGLLCDVADGRFDGWPAMFVAVAASGGPAAAPGTFCRTAGMNPAARYDEDKSRASPVRGLDWVAQNLSGSIASSAVIGNAASVILPWALFVNSRGIMCQIGWL